MLKFCLLITDQKTTARTVMLDEFQVWDDIFFTFEIQMLVQSIWRDIF